MCRSFRCTQSLKCTQSIKIVRREEERSSLPIVLVVAMVKPADPTVRDPIAGMFPGAGCLLFGTDAIVPIATSPVELVLQRVLGLGLRIRGLVVVVCSFQSC